MSPYGVGARKKYWRRAARYKRPGEAFVSSSDRDRYVGRVLYKSSLDGSTTKKFNILILRSTQ